MPDPSIFPNGLGLDGLVGSMTAERTNGSRIKYNEKIMSRGLVEDQMV